jgi:fructokinase
MQIALAGEALIDFTGTGPLAFQGHEGGGVFNSAIACARLGRPTAFITQLSTDLFGEQLLRTLQGNGIDTRHVTRCPAPSTLAFVERSAHTNRYAFYRQATADTLWAPAQLPELPASCRVLLFGSISLLQEPAAGRITDLVEASAGRRIVVLDPNMRASLLDDPAAYHQRFVRWLRSTDLLKLSDEDAVLLAPGQSPEAAVAGWLQGEGGPGVVVLTRGAAGASLYRRGRPALSVTAPSVPVVDTIGAGDTFSAGLVVALLDQGVTDAAQLTALDDAAWTAALHFAVTAAALNCTREGADPPTRAEVLAHLCARLPACPERKPLPMTTPFHLYLDSADLAELRGCLPHPVVHGVTTNPTLLRRAGLARAELPGLLTRCLELGARQVQAQVHAADMEGMLTDAQGLLRSFDPGQLVIKIPATRAGLAAGAVLSGRGVPVTYTAVYALEQAHFAAQLGAAYAAPYLGRLLDAGIDGLALIGRMQALVAASGSALRMLPASVRSRQAYLDLLQLGVGAITIPPRLFGELMDHPATLEAERGFLADAAAQD